MGPLSPRIQADSVAQADRILHIERGDLFPGIGSTARKVPRGGTGFLFLKGKSDQDEPCLELGASSLLLEREPLLIASPAPLGA